MLCLIVEGKNDVKKIKEVFNDGIEFIMLDGVNFSIAKSNEIQTLLENNKMVFIMTDPDKAGDSVATLIQRKFPTIKRISVLPEKARILKSKGYKYGVEYCSRNYIHSLLFEYLDWAN
jgi:ribonuclease M5